MPDQMNETRHPVPCAPWPSGAWFCASIRRMSRWRLSHFTSEVLEHGWPEPYLAAMSQARSQCRERPSRSGLALALSFSGRHDWPVLTSSTINNACPCHFPIPSPSLCRRFAPVLHSTRQPSLPRPHISRITRILHHAWWKGKVDRWKGRLEGGHWQGSEVAQREGRFAG